MLTVKEAAVLLHVTPQTVYRWIEDNILPARRYPTGTVKIEEADVQALIEQSKSPADA